MVLRRAGWPLDTSCITPVVAHLLLLTLCALPLGADLDHHNKELRDGLVDWLKWLHSDIGFEGWRFDFVRGYAPKYCRE